MYFSRRFLAHSGKNNIGVLVLVFLTMTGGWKNREEEALEQTGIP